MATPEPTSTFRQVRKGMEVQTSDGHRLGKVTEVWSGTDPSASSPRCDEDICSRLEVHHGLLGHATLFVPYNAVASASGDRVLLNIDLATVNEHDWAKKPLWIAGTDDSIHPDKLEDKYKGFLSRS